MQPDQNPYGFIMNSGEQPKKGLLPSPSSKKMKILLVVGGFIILLMIAGIIFSFLSKSNDGNSQQLLKLAQTHTEIIRIAEIGTEKARGPQARNLATTTKLALQSSQSELMGVVNKTRKVSSKELNGGQNTETDNTLTTAEQRNRFDEVFIEVLTQELNSYRQQLKTVYDESKSEANKRVYSNIFNQVTALLPQQAEE